ncbi:MAG: hypothetical protein JXA42_15845 [Anaerolineales bacterium]|nr:hypothetical protein [Anaerolineales bacterium]
MEISPKEAEEALATVQKVMLRTHRSIAGSGAVITLIVTGVVWLVGFMSTQFLPQVAAYVWIGVSILGSAVATFYGIRMGRRFRIPASAVIARRITLTWLFLALFCVAVITVVWPIDGKQLTAIILLFVMVGYLAMGLLLSYVFVWWALPVAALVLIGYFFVPDYFYLWMSLLGGGGMIALGVYIRTRW